MDEKIIPGGTPSPEQGSTPTPTPPVEWSTTVTVETLQKQLEERDAKLADLTNQTRRLQSTSDSIVNKLQSDIQTLQKFHDTDWLTVDEKYQALKAMGEKEKELLTYRDSLKSDTKADSIFDQAVQTLWDMWLDEESETWKIMSSLIKKGWEDSLEVVNFAMSILNAVRKDVEWYSESPPSPTPATLWWTPWWNTPPPSWGAVEIKRDVFAKGTDEERTHARNAFKNFLWQLKAE